MDYYQESGVALKEQKPGYKNIIWIIIIIALLIVAFVGIRQGWFNFGGSGSTTGQQIEDYDTQNEANMDAEKTFAPVSLARVDTTESFPVQKTLVLNGDLPNGCTYLNDSTQFRDGKTFYVELTTRVEESDICTQALTPYEKSIPLNVGGLPAGMYTVNINGEREIGFEIDQDNDLDFTAGSDK
jgi:inhibitor of cysteine peptidase